ncbi:MAG: HK97 family phage prohead protease [Perlabentimonas sp.]
MNKKFKQLDYQIKAVDDKKGIVQFYSSSFGERDTDADSDGDVMVKGAYAKTIKENFKRIRHLKNHSISVGVPMSLEEDNFGLLVTSQLIMGKQVAKELFEEYKVYAEMGNSMEHSVGFFPIKSDFNNESGVNYIKEVKLMDVTTMETWGANEITPQGALKQFKTIDDAITAMKLMVNGRFEDEKLQQIDNTLNKLKALVNDEPGTPTQRNEPLNEILKKLQTTENLLTNGRKNN